MAKKKKKKDDEKKKFEYSNEVIGIILILASIIGIGAYGPAGNFIRSFAIFLVGNIYVFLLLGLLILGGYLILKRKMPNFFTGRLIGFYLLVISLLTMAHMNYVDTGVSLGTAVNNSIDVFLRVISSSYDGLSQTGGGIIGLFFSFIFVITLPIFK